MKSGGGSSKVQARPGRSVAKLLALAGLTLLAYLPSFHAAFQYDDFAGIVGNRYIHVRDLSLASLRGAAFQDRRQNRPLGNLTLAVNYFFNGTDPFGYHLVNFGILLLTALGIWLLLEKLMGKLGFDPGRARLAAWLAAMVWAVHPVNTQAVTYIVQRHASLAGLFSVWSIYLFHLGLEKGRRIFFVGAGMLCASALLSKETAITLPTIMLAYKIYFFDGLKPGWLRRNRKWALTLLLFYLAAGAVFLRPGMLAKVSDDLGQAQFTPWQRLAARPMALCWYPLIIIFPFPQFQSLLHDFSWSGSALQVAAMIVSAMIILALIFLAASRAAAQRVFSFCVLWYFGQLLVEAMPLPIAVAHEHRLYLASLAMIAPAIAWPVLKVKNLKAAAAWILVIALFFSGFTFMRNRVWQSQESLWHDTAMKSPALLWSWYYYCLALGETGKCRKTIFACSMATAVADNDYKVRNNLGICYFQTGRADLAEGELLKAVEYSPDHVDFTALNLGLFYSGLKDYEPAVKYLELAFSRNPKSVKTRQVLALTYAETGRCQQAFELIRSAPGAFPDLSEIARLCPNPLK